MSLDLDIIIADDANDALKRSGTMMGNTAARIPETQDVRVTGFADRAWYRTESASGGGLQSARLIWQRANVISSLFVFQRTGFSTSEFFAVAERIGRRIDAARAGTPEPAAVLPVSCEDIHIPLAMAWTPPFRGAMLGQPGSTIVMWDNNGIPRAIPAEKTEDGEYMVPLEALALVCPGKYERASTQRQPIVVTLAGQAVVLTRDSAEAVIGGRAVTLKRPVEVRIYGRIGTRERPVKMGEQSRAVWVPLSLLEQVTGKPLKWSVENGRTTARF